MRSRKLLAFILCLITGPALAGYMTLLGAGLGAIQPVAQATFTNSSYSTNLSNLTSVATFSRAGNATQFDSSGYLTYGPSQLLLQNTNFSDDAWSKNNVTITGGQADPVGGSAAARLQGTVVSNWYMAQTANSNSNALIALWVKSNTGSKQSFRLMTKSGSVLSADLTATTSWQQFNLVGDNSTGFVGIIYGSGGATVDLLVYKATLSAVTYETTPRAQDQVITTSAAYYGPRIDYDPNTLAVKGLLIEEARTNLVIQSSALTGASWSPQGTARGSDATFDLTGATAVKLTASAGGGNHQLISSGNVALANATAYTYSWYVKGGTYSKISIGLGDGTRYSAAVFDISGTSGAVATQTASTGDTGVSGVSTYLGSGWFRCALTFTSSGASSRFANIGMVGATTGNGFSLYGEGTFSAAGTETIYVGQPQAEAGSFASSYTPTGASAVTRPAETVQFTGTALSTALGSVASAFVEVGGLPVQSGTIRYLQYGAGSGILLGMSSGSATTVYEQNTAGSASATAVAGSGSIATALRAGVSWGSTGGRKLVANGGTVATDASNNELATGTVNLGQGQGTYINGWLRSFAIYNSRLPDATLQAKSVVGASY